MRELVISSVPLDKLYCLLKGQDVKRLDSSSDRRLWGRGNLYRVEGRGVQSQGVIYTL